MAKIDKIFKYSKKEDKKFFFFLQNHGIIRPNAHLDSFEALVYSCQI